MAKAKQLTPKDFYTLPRAVEGRPVYLRMPEGNKSEHYLMVLGMDSPAAQQLLGDSAMRVQQAREENREETEILKIREQETLTFRAGLVLGWSFSKVPKAEEVRDLLSNNPGLAERVEQFSSTPGLFYGADKFYA